MGVGAQVTTCFSRQNPYAHWIQDHNLNENNSYCKLKCDAYLDKNFFTGFIFPDVIVVILSVWVYLLEPSGCNAKCKFPAMIIKESRMEIKQSTINKFSMSYIAASLGLSVSYLFVFGIKDVTIQSNFVNSNLKNILIILSLLGFIAIDFLYLKVIMRYAYQCKFLINYFLLIMYTQRALNFKAKQKVMVAVTQYGLQSDNKKELQSLINF